MVNDNVAVGLGGPEVGFVNEKHYVEELLENWPPPPAHRPPPPRDDAPHKWWAAYERAMALDSGPVA